MARLMAYKLVASTGATTKKPDTALANNRDLRVALLNIDQARAQLLQARELENNLQGLRYAAEEDELEQELAEIK